MSTSLDALRRGDLAGATTFRLPPGTGAFPPELFGLAETLEVLDLSGAGLTSLPTDLGRLSKLRVLFCSGNRFERLPPVLGDCAALSQIGFRGTGLHEVPAEALPRSLRWLTLTDNRIERLPDALGDRPLLQKLMLAGNRLRTLPRTLDRATGLELVRLSASGLESVPEGLARLPRLAWIAWAGNPFERTASVASVPSVPWRDISLGALLGEGASGRVHRALWRRYGDDREVALKLFKGAITSDGLPDREMAACMAAGDHPNLTGAAGRLADHPDGTEGFVMPLLPETWRVLAGPPSLESCTRDVYDPALRLDPAVARRLVGSAAAATAHLHARSLMHGDLYAHNLLWDGRDGDAVLSDFGAASVLPAGTEAEPWQRVEVRAWGLLLGEVLGRMTEEPADIARLRALQEACTQPDPALRPLMADIVAHLRPA